MREVGTERLGYNHEIYRSAVNRTWDSQDTWIEGQRHGEGTSRKGQRNDWRLMEGTSSSCPGKKYPSVLGIVES